MIAVDLENRHKIPIYPQTLDMTDNIMQGIFGTTRKYAISALGLYRAMYFKNGTIQCYENQTYDDCR